ncbi:MAG: MmgE/PrpD family protein [Candidatus Binatia bacterium]|nr:MmgE/PrpD family protein [Candidatus Binatia bacterium]
MRDTAEQHPEQASAEARAASASEQLAQFAARTTFGQLPEAVREKVALHVLDTLGVALAACPEQFARKAMAALEPVAGRGRASVLGHARRWPAAWAALYNGMLAHGLDYDDTHAEAVLHVSTTVVPAALAVAEERELAGSDFLAAVAVGMEVNARIGLAAPGAFHDRGFHPTGICGAYAASVAASKAFGLDARAMADALGIAGSQAAGTLEFLGDGSWSKRLHAGWAAHAGVLAARLGSAGFLGPRATFEGRFGLYRTHLGDRGWDVGVLTDGLGTRWRLLEVSLKPYPACHMVHAFIDAARVLRERPGFALDRIAAIEADIHPRAVPVVCEPLANKWMPRTDYEAKFSLPYTVAAMLVRGHVNVDDFTPAAISDEAVLAVARLVRYRQDETSRYPRYFDGTLRIRFRDGSVWEHRQAINRGHPELPLTRDEVLDKFRHNVCRVATDAAAKQLEVEVTTLPTRPSLGRLRSALLAAAKNARPGGPSR